VIQSASHAKLAAAGQVIAGDAELTRLPPVFAAEADAVAAHGLVFIEMVATGAATDPEALQGCVLRQGSSTRLCQQRGGRGDNSVNHVDSL
jgi:hypothetical protein